MATTQLHKVLSEIEELKQQNAEIKAMVQQLIRLVPVEKVNSAKSPADIALEMARSGDVEGSKAYLKSLSSRRAA